MHARLVLLLACLPGCARTPADDPFGQGTDSPTDAADTDASDPCATTVSWTFGGAPDDFRAVPTTWEDQQATLEAQPFETGYRVSKDGDCLLLNPGALALEALPTGCAIASVRIRVTDHCGPACTQAFAAAASTRVASTSNVGSDSEEVLTLHPLDPFSTAVIGSLDARVCAIEATLTAIPDGLRPPDTAAPF